MHPAPIDRRHGEIAQWAMPRDRGGWYDREIKSNVTSAPWLSTSGISMDDASGCHCVSDYSRISPLSGCLDKSSTRAPVLSLFISYNWINNSRGIKRGSCANDTVRDTRYHVASPIDQSRHVCWYVFIVVYHTSTGITLCSPYDFKTLRYFIWSVDYRSVREAICAMIFGDTDRNT